MVTGSAPHLSPFPASGERGNSPREIVLLLPKIVVTLLLVLAVGDMLAGVFLRYVMVAITDFLDLDPVNFFWVEEVGELSLAWLTLIGAAIGIQSRSHFALSVFVHRLPEATQLWIHRLNHALITAVGLLVAWYGFKLCLLNHTLTTPGLEINLAWLYASSVVGGVLIAIYGLAMMLSPLPQGELQH